jgi:mRNA-degrading endonuclease RelE of RelBE toxin-antitoxin system
VLQWPVARGKDKIIPKILNDPYHAGKNLSGRLSGLKSYVFKSSGVEYRIVYDIDEKTNCVFLLMAGPRENIYKRLLRRITG